MCACREGHEEIVLFLISYGVDVSMSTKVMNQGMIGIDHN